MTKRLRGALDVYHGSKRQLSHSLQLIFGHEESFLDAGRDKTIKGPGREKFIVRTSVIGILANIVLTVFKLIVGIAASSIAIILDAVNSATDALASVVTIAGVKLAGRRPDRKHPFGYGRSEYLASAVVAIIIVAAGAISLKESIEKIIWPGEPSYDLITIIVIVAVVITKIVLGIYFKRCGKIANSEALIGSGVDALYDAILSAGTLVVIFAQMWFDVNIDGIVGAIISLFVLKAGFDVLRDSIRPILGAAEDADTAQEIRAYVEDIPGVLGAYDLIVVDFGPSEFFGSIHIEVEDDLTAQEIHRLTQSISRGVYEQFHIILTVGIYAANSTGDYRDMHAYLKELCADQPQILQLHGFYVDEASKTVYFDLVIDFDADAQAISEQVVASMKERYPDYSYSDVIDADYVA